MPQSQELTGTKRFTTKVAAMAGRLSIGRRENKDQDAGNEFGRRVDVHTALADLLEQGYDTVSTGSGPVVHDGVDRVAGEYQVTKSEVSEDDLTVAITTYKNYDSSASAKFGPYQRDFTPAQYADHVAEWQIQFGAAGSLADKVAEFTPPATQLPPQ